MPLTKRQLRDGLAFKMGTVITRFSTTGAGSSTTLVSSDVSGQPPDEFVGTYPLVLTGAESVKWRECTAYTASSGTFTIVPALAGAAGAAVTVEVHGIRPDLYTLAINDAIKRAYGDLRIPRRNWGGVLTTSGIYAYPVPRQFDDVTRILYELQSSRVYYDTFDRADSATSAGTSTSGHTLTISSGDTFGISSDQLYSVSDTDGDLAIVDNVFLTDGYWEVDILGTLADATTYRVPCLVFAYQDASNYLVVRLRDTSTNATGAVDLRKVDGGSESSLAEAAFTVADNQYYRVRIQRIGTRITVFVDEQEILNHELIGPNFKYTGQDFISDTYGQVGYRLDKGGSPATAARWRRASLRKVVSVAERSDWTLSADKRTVQFGSGSTGHTGFSDDRCLIFEGRSYLTDLTDDSTFGTLDSDSTERVELTLDTRETDLLLTWAKHFLYKRLSSPFLTRYMEAQDKFERLAQEALQEAMQATGRARQRQPVANLKHLGWG